MKVRRLETQDFENMTKLEVRSLADELPSGSVDAIERTVRFVCAETQGLWHGRGRAMMCRRLKHLELPRAHRDRLIGVILERLLGGHFSEQFKDQLRLALHIDAAKTLAAARGAAVSGRPHIRRYALWLLSQDEAAHDA
jgi:hypothetical protein